MFSPLSSGRDGAEGACIVSFGSHIDVISFPAPVSVSKVARLCKVPAGNVGQMAVHKLQAVSGLFLRGPQM